VAADSPVVVDAATVAKWGFNETDSATALRLFDAWAAQTLSLRAPDVLVAELGSICRRKVRAGEVTADHAQQVHQVLHAILPPLVPSEDLADEALLLASRHDRPFAEALHLALAIRDGAIYVTADERMFRLLAPSFSCVQHLEDVAV